MTDLINATKKCDLNKNMRYLIILLSLGIVSSCGSFEVLKGLCYDDVNGTFLCPAPNIEKHIPPQAPLPVEPLCDGPSPILEPEVAECIMVA